MISNEKPLAAGLKPVGVITKNIVLSKPVVSGPVKVGSKVVNINQQKQDSLVKPSNQNVALAGDMKYDEHLTISLESKNKANC